MPFLDENGLATLWGLIKTKVATKQNSITASGMLKGDGSGGVSAAVAGADYVAPSGSITGNAATATTATKLGTSTVGGAAKPIYLNAGTATACSSTVGGATRPVYMNAGAITGITATAVAYGGTGATTAAAARTNLGAAATVTYTATVTATWTASESYYYQTITVSGILATDNPIVDIKCGSDNAANVVYSENMGKVFRITTAANSITVWATEAISSAFPIQLKVVR